MTRGDIEDFIGDLLERRKPATVATRYAGLWAFLRWLVEEGELERSPMEGMRPPKLDEAPVPLLPSDDVQRLLRACAGRTFLDRRDAAIVRLLYDTGMRVGEMVRIGCDDLHLDDGVVLVMGKGRRQRLQPFGVKASCTEHRPC